MEIYEMTALQVAEKIKNREITAMDAVESIAKAIELRDETYNCYTSFDKNSALENAERVQKKIDAGEPVSELAGVPIAIKDNICEKGKLTSCASKILYNFKPPYNATVINKLDACDMIAFGKVNMDEFAMGSTTETSFYGATKNPWDVTRVPGGSSGGAAASVAADESIVALGSDTGGSIRQPASFCGVTGLKPTYGSVSRYGLIAYASSLDQIGPIGKDVLDVAAVFNVIKGKDEKDGTSMQSEIFSLDDIKIDSLKGKKVGIPNDYFGEGINDEVAQRVMAAAQTLKALGAEIEQFDMPIVKYAIPTYYIIACAEACSNLSRFDGIKYGYKAEDALNLRDVYFKSRSEGFGMEVKKRIMLGNFVLSSGYFDAYYKKALQAKGLICKAFNDAFEKYDFLLGPVAPTTALKMGEGLSDPLAMYLGDIYTVMINISGLPSLALPCGFDSNNMPVGMQLIGKPFDEKTVLSAGYAFQNVTDFHKKKPSLV
ncbi:Asp-tRNA(Asn)/Glu-tRNA(Gln) amidotransferase subunit GatA [uncultured Eubacterium sp.]|uniref:Asp-tRNA(Asn)/Glu-tRNA(Gln) amidotransferase subunit GatA n=1 Tax=uncultured Eubacterium sp. TaxID=165185 RepID=UPI0015AE8A9F|nr:Asp-tRNA(Asn)/Glu-tRNA(Gln) amidotransferase subunit GatA [uncultured Eubacterium sp.]